jgi:elongation factor P
LAAGRTAAHHVGMATVSTNDLKNGMCLDLPEGLVQVVEFQHVKPGKGGAFVRTTLKNVRTGGQIDKTFRAGEKVEQAKIDRREYQYLYNDGANYVFMDAETYDQIEVPPVALGDATNYLVEQATATLMMYGSEIVGVELPPSVELTVAETEPGLQGDRSTGGTKPATLETGYVVQVPLFINTGEKLKIDTRTGQYQSRA